MSIYDNVTDFEACLFTKNIKNLNMVRMKDDFFFQVKQFIYNTLQATT